MEELSVGSGSNLIDNGWLEIEEDGSWDVLAGTSLAKEGVEGIIATTNSLVRGHLTVGLNTVLEAEELPAGVTNLDTGLTDVDRNNFSHGDVLSLFVKRLFQLDRESKNQLLYCYTLAFIFYIEIKIKENF